MREKSYREKFELRSEVSVGANLVKESPSMREYEAKTPGQNGHWPKRQFASGDSKQRQDTEVGRGRGAAMLCRSGEAANHTLKSGGNRFATSRSL